MVTEGQGQDADCLQESWTHMFGIPVPWSYLLRNVNKDPACLPQRLLRGPRGTVNRSYKVKSLFMWPITVNKIAACSTDYGLNWHSQVSSPFLGIIFVPAVTDP